MTYLVAPAKYPRLDRLKDRSGAWCWSDRLCILFYTSRVTKKEILVALSVGGPPPLGNIWRITAKNTDFYLDPLTHSETFHLSVHGPNNQHPDGHRFHVKANRRGVSGLQVRGDFISHTIPRKGFAFDGQAVAEGVFRVARIRWRWDLQRPRFRTAAAVPGALPDVDGPNISGAVMSGMLEANDAADLDVFVAYDGPYWPDPKNSLRDNARLGPLQNEAGMWLTATAYRRPETVTATPEGLNFPLPRIGEDPIRIMAGGLGENDAGEIYWFVEAITSRQFMDVAR